MLTQTEADTLIAMRKIYVNPGTVSIPPGCDQTHKLTSDDKRELFLLDLWRGTIRLSKLKLQTRGQKVIVLVRLDVDGAPHTNPDGIKLPGTHLHIYREGYEDRWAVSLSLNEFRNPTNIRQCFQDFSRYCNVEIPPFQDGLI